MKRDTSHADAQRWMHLHQLATEAGVTCLDTAWLGAKVKYRFRCAQGHTWERVPSNVRKSAGCPYCRSKRESHERLLHDGRDRLRQAAARHGGVCLSDHYTGVHQRYRFRCEQEHVWEATGHNILRGRWCPSCKGAKIRRSKQLAEGLAQLCAAARQHGGQCLSTAYDNLKTRYRFTCAKGHQWDDTGEAILRGRWCRRCGYTRPRYTLKDAQEEARKRGGQCLSDAYRNSATRIHWLCHRGHSWWTPFATIRNGHWCPVCAKLDRISSRRSKARHRYRATGEKSSL